MKLHELQPATGSHGSPTTVWVVVLHLVMSKNFWPWSKGQKARSGGGVRLVWWTNSIVRRPPKRGFTNINAKEYAV